MSAGFYVTMIRGAAPRDRLAFLAGPFPTKAAAELARPSAERLACHLDAWADFDGFGVTMLDPPHRLGVFNHMVRNDFTGSHGVKHV